MSRSLISGWGFIAALIAIPAWATGQPRQEDYTIHGTDIQLNVTIQLNAGELFDKCSFDAAAPGNDAFICAGFLAGVEDGMTIVWASNGLPRAFCPPRGTRRGILLERFMDYMRAHPEKRTLPAALVTLQAYREMWPCPAPGAP
jgi:hypothetical protein